MVTDFYSQMSNVHDVLNNITDDFCGYQSYFNGMDAYFLLSNF